jgi:hypothetical protein
MTGCVQPEWKKKHIETVSTEAIAHVMLPMLTFRPLLTKDERMVAVKAIQNLFL